MAGAAVVWGPGGHVLCAAMRAPRAPANARTSQQTRNSCVATRRPGPCVLRSTSRRAVAAKALDRPINVLVLGSGGREHALCWKLASSPSARKVFCAPGNAGIALEPSVTVVPTLKLSDFEGLAALCRDESIEMVVVGPEQPLVDSVADFLTSRGVAVFGPTAAAARLEGSKAYMKGVCDKYGVPTAKSKSFTDAKAAAAFAEELGAPLVVKASGLAAGKGVSVCATLDEARQAIEDMMVERIFGDAGSTVVVEEFLEGEEVSYFALVDGSTVVPLGSAQDHKAAYDGDKGPNTGGMGAYTPAPVLTPDVDEEVRRVILQTTAEGMVKEGSPYRGVIFAGLMVKDSKPKLLEYNVRFGDPECQVLMMRLKSDLVEVLYKTCQGRLSEVGELEWTGDKALTVVMAAKGYPGEYRKGTEIRGLDAAARVASTKVFHAGTATGASGGVVASGGRVLSVTATAPTISEAQRRAYEAVGAVQWEDAQFRRDIGWRAVEREKGGSTAR